MGVERLFFSRNVQTALGVARRARAPPRPARHPGPRSDARPARSRARSRATVRRQGRSRDGPAVLGMSELAAARRRGRCSRSRPRRTRRGRDGHGRDLDQGCRRPDPSRRAATSGPSARRSPRSAPSADKRSAS
jgi:hypothetical protein